MNKGQSSKGATVAELIVWAGSDAAWDAMRSGRPQVAVMAFKQEIEKSVLKIAGPVPDSVKVTENRVIIRKDEMSCRMVITAESETPLAAIADDLSSTKSLHVYWKARTASLLLVGDTNVAFSVSGVKSEAARLKVLTLPVEKLSDGRLLIDNGNDPKLPVFQYEGVSNCTTVLKFADDIFTEKAPNYDCCFAGRSVILDNKVTLSVELANGPGKQVVFANTLEGEGICESMTVATVGEQPHFYWRRSQLTVQGSRQDFIAHVRAVVAQFRREHGTIYRARLAGAEI